MCCVCCCFVRVVLLLKMFVCLAGGLLRRCMVSVMSVCVVCALVCVFVCLMCLCAWFETYRVMLSCLDDVGVLFLWVCWFV